MRLYLTLSLLLSSLFCAFGQESLRLVPDQNCGSISEIFLIDDSDQVVKAQLAGPSYKISSDRIGLARYNIYLSPDEGLQHLAKNIWLEGSAILQLDCVDNKLEVQFSDLSGQTKSDSLNSFVDTFTAYLNSAEADEDLDLTPIVHNIDNSLGRILLEAYAHSFRFNPEEASELQLAVARALAEQNSIAYSFSMLEQIAQGIQVELPELGLTAYGTSTTEAFDRLNQSKYVIDWWFSGCLPCIEHHATMLEQSIYDQFLAQGYEFVGISVGFSSQAWYEYMDAKELPWPNYRLSNDYDHDNDPLSSVFMGALPTYFIVENGTMVHATNDLEELVRYITE